jgi:Mg-chelatase subunit ChlD
MSKFATAMNASATTWNGATSYVSPDPTGQTSGRVSLFFKGVRGLNAPRLYEYLRECARESLVDTFLLVFHLRDCRGGKGERLLGRQALTWLFINYPTEFGLVLHLIPEYGRWDDLLQLFPSVLNLTNVDQVRENYSVAGPLQLETLQTLQALQKKVVTLMASQLREDQKNMLEGNPCSVCAKWTPTEGDSLDRKTGIFKTLAAEVGVSAQSLRKSFNTPLRAYLKIVEKHMCTGQWSAIDFNKVPSCAMKRLKKAFEKHDPQRFTEWHTALKLGKTAKVNAKQLYPHELVREIRTKHACDEVTEAQWKVLVEEVRKLGSLKDAVAVVDTSSSMHEPDCLPLDVAVSMGLIISEVVQGDFHGQLLTFNRKPAFRCIPDGKLFDRWDAVRLMDWGGSTDLEATFKLILNRGRDYKLSQEDMPKRLFIISDMQFNDVSSEKTNMENINDMYKAAGYTRPQIVFWNVNGGSSDFPVTVGEHGTVMISGFSPAILKCLIRGEDYSSNVVLRATLDDERYDPVRKALQQ